MKTTFRLKMFVTVICLLLAVSPAQAAPQAPGATVLYAAPTAQGSEDCSSWGNACTLQTALTSAVSGDEIWVQAGVHKPTTDPLFRNAKFTLKSGVALYGGFAGDETNRSQRNWQLYATVLSGDIDSNDITDVSGVVTDTAHINGANSYHVVQCDDQDATAVMDGFFITGGQATGYPAYWGGGLYNGYCSPTLTNLVFSGNTALNEGGGMYNDGSSPVVTNVIFTGNTAGQGGGGMRNYRGSAPLLINVAFYNNQSKNGGGMYASSNSTPTVVNGIFVGNTANLGGAMLIQDSSPAFRNLTMTGNTATINGGAIYLFSDSKPTLTNAILWGNSAPTGPEIFKDSSSLPVVTYSDVQGGYTGAGNINVDPLFVDVPGGNLRLQPTSPAVDAGDNAAVPADITTDLDGNPRFIDLPVADTGNGTSPIVDMGAYEAYEDGAAPTVVSSIRFDANPTSAAQVRFLVTFSEPVVGVDASDFALTSDSLSGAKVAGARGMGADYLVFVDTGSGEGTLRLDVSAAASFTDLSGNTVSGLPFEGGEEYEVSHGFQVFLPQVTRR